jgi:hypothetical protein
MSKHRQRPGNLVRIGVSVDADLLAAFDAAGPTNLSRSAKVVEAMRRYIAHHQGATPTPRPTPTTTDDAITFDEE